MEIEKATPLILKFTLNEEEVMKLYSYQPVDTASVGGAAIRIQLVQTSAPPLARPASRAAPHPTTTNGHTPAPSSEELSTPGEICAEIAATGYASYRSFLLKKHPMSYEISWYQGANYSTAKRLIGKTGRIEDLMRLIDEQLAVE